MSQLNVQKVRAADDRTLPVFSEFARLAEEIRLKAYNLFAHRGDGGDGGSHALDDWLAAEREVCWPSAELTEGDAVCTVKVALAGFEPGEINVTATPREILIKAAHERERQSAKEGDGKLCWSEFRSNEVLRRIELPAPVNVDKISARLSNGLLEIVAPKADNSAQAATRVPVAAAS